MKALALMFVGIVAASGCSKVFGHRVTDAGKAGTRTITAGPGKTLSAFTRIESRGAFDVEVKQGPQSDVVIEGDENIVKIVDCKVDGDTLVVKTTENYTTSTPLKVKVTIPTIAALDLSGSGTIHASDVSTTKLDIDLAGSGQIKVNGRVQSLTVDLSGSGEIEASALEAQQAIVDLAGSGSMELFATKELNAEVSGSGEVRFKGSPHVFKDITGSGSVEQVR